MFSRFQFIISVLFRLYRGSNDNFWCNDCETDINKPRLIEAILYCLSVFRDSQRLPHGPRSYILRTAVEVHGKFSVNDQSYGRHFVKIDRKVRSWRQVNLLVRSYTSGCLSSRPSVLYACSSYSTFPPVLLHVTSNSSSLFATPI